MSVSGKISQIAGLATYPTNLMWSAASGMVARNSGATSCQSRAGSTPMEHANSLVS
jgi:hypothetical protein